MQNKSYYEITLGPSFVLACADDVRVAEELFYNYKYSGCIRYPELLEAHYISNGKQFEALFEPLTRQRWQRGERRF